MGDSELLVFIVVVLGILASSVSFIFHMSRLLGWISWPVTIALSATSAPQFWMNWQRGSVEGVSWIMFSVIWLGMVVLFFRSLREPTSRVIRFNYCCGSFFLLLVNAQIIYFRYLV